MRTYTNKIFGKEELNEKCFNNTNFLFIDNSFPHIIGGLDKFGSALYEQLYKSIRSLTLYLIIIIIISLFVLTLTFFVTYRTILSILHSLNELVNIIFIIPTSAFNMVPPLKKFIETSSFEED